MTQRRLSRSPLLLVALGCALAFAACGSNVGQLFSFHRGGGGTGANDASGIVLLTALGKLADVRPKVEAAFPQSGGWPTTVPVVIVFSESVSRDSVEPPATGTGAPPAARVGLRVQGTTQSLPVSIDYLFGDRVVVLRPSAPLPNTTTFEAFVGADVADLDAVKKGGAEQVVATFRADQTDTIKNGRILTTLPPANAKDVYRETEFIAVFDRPVDTASITTANFRIGDGTTDVQGSLDTPLRVQGQSDPRFYRFRPRNPLAGSTQFRFTVDDTIKFNSGAGQLDFGNKTPFLRFDTVAFAVPTRVALGNATTGFADKINAQNAASAVVDVDVDASATVGSQVKLRVYGLDPSTKAVGDITFFDTSTTLTVPGPTTVSLPIGAALGSPGRYFFEEGPVVFVVRLVSGDHSSSFRSSADGSTDPRFDVTPPSVTAWLPAVTGSPDAVVTDQDAIAVYGKASETIGSAELTDGTATAALWSADGSANFMMRPLQVPRSSAVRTLTLNITDAAGNMSTTASTIHLTRRGFATGSFAGTLTVEVYDDATLAPIAGATVAVEPGVPQKPAVGRVFSTTDASGRAVFTTLPGPRNTITVIAANHHITTLLDTPSSFVSIAAVPQAASAFASVKGTLAFVPVTGQTAKVGANLLTDPLQLEIATGSPSVTSIPQTAIRASRPLLLTGFTGNFEPTTTPAYVGFFCAICGATGAGAAPALAPQESGAVLDTTQAVLGTNGVIAGLLAPYNVDFSAATGLGAIDGAVRVRPVVTLGGFAGGSLFGAGVATSSGGGLFQIAANWPLSSITALAPLGPVLWVQAQAGDAAGNTTIHRALITTPTLGVAYNTGAPLGIPTITSPGGASTGSPSIRFEDRLDASTLPGGFGFHTLRVQDASGLRWTLIEQDFDGAGATRDVQVPDLTGLGAGMAVGTWKVRVTSELMFGVGYGDGEFGFEERYRQLVKASRTADVDFTIQ